MCEAIRTAYSVKEGTSYVRRINVELAPMSVEDFAKLQKERIGTYVCFQETYDPILYKQYHPAGNPESRLREQGHGFLTGPWKPVSATWGSEYSSASPITASRCWR